MIWPARAASAALPTDVHVAVAAIPAAATNREYVMTIDLLPTFARLTGATLPARPTATPATWVQRVTVAPRNVGTLAP